MTRNQIENLFKTHYAQMYRLAVTILYDEAESKDVVSEVFARLLGQSDMLKADTAERYLLTAVRNQCRNVLEHRQVHERFFRLMSDEAVQSTLSNDEQIRMEELMHYIRQQLPPLSQEIFRLRYLREMTCQEVADTLGISRQTVHSHLQQSIERIREYFKSNT
jgi:RNA polymerase sigma factor, sigma-70 family